MMNNDGAGATRTKSGLWACAIVRSAGYNKTESAMGNRTRSRHTGGSIHNKWTAVPGSGTGGNVNGYSHGNSGGSHGGGSGY